MTGKCTAPLQATTDARRICAMFGATGGPPVIKAVLDRLPADFPIPILVCQSLGIGYAQRFAAWLDESSPLTVKLAEAGEIIVPATVYVAHGDHHLGVSRNGKIVLSESPPINGYRPSSTFLFESVAKSYAEGSVAMIAAGMRHDGVDALVALHEAGGTVVAVDEESAMVFGTQRAAIEAGAVDRVLPRDEIADYLVQLVQRPLR